jgi:hypothetical protein
LKGTLHKLYSQCWQVSYFVHQSKDFMKCFLSRGTFRSSTSRCLTRRITILPVRRIQDIEYLSPKEELTSSDVLTMKTEVHQPCKISLFYVKTWRSQWSRGLRRRSAAACLMRLWVRIPPGAWTSVWYDCCVSSGRGLCDELFNRPEEFYRLRCVVECDLETSRMRRPWPTGGLSPQKQTNKKRNIPWYDIWWYMIRYDMMCGIWYDVIYDMIWYDTIWYDTIWYMIWYDMMYGMIWYDTIWYDMIYDDIRYMIWYDTIWYDMTWYTIW